MNKHQPVQKLSAWDRLLTRPDRPLPTVQDPAAPRGYPADPKPVPPEGHAADPGASDIGRTA